MDGPGAVIAWLAQLPISPHFDSPYMSRTISEFWSKRWNLTVGNLLRLLVYDPVHEGKCASGQCQALAEFNTRWVWNDAICCGAGRLVKRDEPYTAVRLRSFAAVCLTFVVSGLMHEFLMW